MGQTWHAPAGAPRPAHRMGLYLRRDLYGAGLVMPWCDTDAIAECRRSPRSGTDAQAGPTTSSWRWPRSPECGDLLEPNRIFILRRHSRCAGTTSSWKIMSLGMRWAHGFWTVGMTHVGDSQAVRSLTQCGEPMRFAMAAPIDLRNDFESHCGALGTRPDVVCFGTMPCVASCRLRAQHGVDSPGAEAQRRHLWDRPRRRRALAARTRRRDHRAGARLRLRSRRGRATIVVPWFADQSARRIHAEEGRDSARPKGKGAVAGCPTIIDAMAAQFETGHSSFPSSVPDNITVLALPPSPELNPVENVWQFMATTGCRTGSSNPTKTSSRCAAKPGTTSSHGRSEPRRKVTSYIGPRGTLIAAGKAPEVSLQTRRGAYFDFPVFRAKSRELL